MKYSSGTSPRMRGKRSNSNQFFIAYGNIPAYAGKTCYRAQTGREFPEHPRVCGENLPYGLPLGIGDGTSPRMRGKHVPAISRARRIRNIPAYAGKTVMRAPTSHPRGGTSPRMRGKRVLDSDPGTGYGNIPAYAGKTRSIGVAALAAWEHPRVCGENNHGRTIR